MARMTLTQAVKDFFGYSSNTQLMAEWKDLDAATKQWLRQELTARGYDIMQPASSWHGFSMGATT